MVLVAGAGDDIERLVRALAAEGFSVERADTEAKAWRAVAKGSPDAVAASARLGRGDALALCRRLRSDPARASIPFLLLTAGPGLEEKRAGFEAGADQCLPAATGVGELALWIRAMVRRGELTARASGAVRCGDWVADPSDHSLRAGGRLICDLSPKEFELLYALMRHRPRVLSKAFLLKEVWRETLRDNTVEAHVKNLRAKLGAGAGRVVTVRGSGYRFD